VTFASRPWRYALSVSVFLRRHRHYDVPLLFHVTLVFVCLKNCCGNCTLTSLSCLPSHLSTHATEHNSRRKTYTTIPTLIGALVHRTYLRSRVRRTPSPMLATLNKLLNYYVIMTTQPSILSGTGNETSSYMSTE